MNFTGTSYITVNGGNIVDLYGASLYNHYSGNTVIEVNGGTISTVYAGGDVTRRLSGTADVEAACVETVHPVILPPEKLPEPGRPQAEQ